MGPRSCSKPSTHLPCTSPSKLSSPCTLQVVPPVSSSTPVMVSPTPSPSTKDTPFPTPSSGWIWPNVAILSPPPPNVKSSVTSRRNSHMLPWTSNRKCRLLPAAPVSRNHTNYPTDKSSPLATSDSDAPSPSSNPPSSVWNLLVSTRPPTTPSRSAMSISVRTCTPTPSCPEVRPCSPVSPTVCRRRSPPSPHPPWRSRSSPHQRGNTPSGLEDPSWLPSPPSNRCGSANKNMTNLAHPSSTENASRLKQKLSWNNGVCA